MAREVNSMRFDSSDDESDHQRRPTSSQGGGGVSASGPRPSSQVKDISTLFVNGDRESIVFCLQDPELDEDEIQDLKDKIKKHGGTVVSNYRVADYVLVDPSTEAGTETIAKHTTPHRRIVSWKFIDESIRRGKLVPNLELALFIKEDVPVVFLLHESLESLEAALEALRDKILLRGGNPKGTPHNAQVVIHSATWNDSKHTMSMFKNIVRTETVAWLESCIARNRFSLDKPPSVSVVHKTSSKPGRKVGGPRNEFTKQDDQFLVAWMATHFGASTAGRAGNRAYKDMVEIPDYLKWSQAHTWQSWRERYKNKKKQLDPLILAYIAEHGTTQPGEGTDEEDNKEAPVLEPKHGPYKKARPQSKKRKPKDDGDDEPEEPESEDSNESYRPEKDVGKEKEKGKRKAKEKAGKGRVEEEIEEADASADTSQSRAKKRARIDAEVRVIKTSSSQAAPASQKPVVRDEPLPPSQKPAPSQKPLSSLQSAPLGKLSSSQTAPPSQKPVVSSKAARRPIQPLSSPPVDDDSASSRAPSPTPPPAQIPEPPRPTLTQSMMTTTTLLESQNTQDTTMSTTTSTEEEASPFALDPALTTSEAQAMLNKRPTVVDQLDQLGLSSSQEQPGDMEDEDEEEGSDVEVGGVSQYPRMRTQEDDELPEEVEDELSKLAQEYDVSLSAVKANFNLAKGMDLKEALDVTREAVEELVQQVRHRGVRHP